MKKKSTGFLLFAVFAAFAAVPQDVDAAAKIIPATICNPYNAGQANDIDYVPSGVRTTAAATRPVICAVPREATIAGATVDVVGTVSANNVISSTLYAYDLSIFKGSASGVNPSGPLGQFVYSLTLSTSVAIPGATLSVVSSLPASANGTLLELYADH